MTIERLISSDAVQSLRDQGFLILTVPTEVGEALHDTFAHGVAFFHVNSGYSARNSGAYLMSVLGFDLEVTICTIAQDRHKQHGEDSDS